MNPHRPFLPRGAFALATLVPLAALLAACSSEPAPVALNVRPAFVVEARAGASDRVAWVGEVRAARRAELAFAVAGRVASVAVDVGDTVHAGQVLARLDAQPLRAQLTAAAGELARAQALRAEAQQRLQRLATAQQAGVASTAETGAVQAEAAAADAALRAAQAQLDLATWQLDQAVLRAPVDGVVGTRQLEPGQSAGPGAPGLAIDGAGRELAVLVPAARTLKPGQPVTLRQGDQTLPSRVLRTAARLEAGGVRRVFLAVPETAAVGSTWSVDIEVPGGATALQVPLRAVLPAAEPGRGQVLRVAQDGRTEAVVVMLGPLHGEWVEVDQGLAPHDRVVVAGAVAIAPGTVVAPVAWRAEDAR